MTKPTGKVLVIDNRASLFELCRRSLGENGHEITCIEGSLAVMAARKELYDLVILSVDDEGVGGAEILRQIVEVRPLIVAILVCGKEDFLQTYDILKTGLCRVCAKPVDPDQLAGIVDEIFQNGILRDDTTRMKTLLPLYTLGKKFIAAQSRQQVYEELVNAVTIEVEVPTVSLMMFDKDSNALKVVAYRGLDPVFVDNLQIKAGERIAGKVYQSQKPVIINKDNQHLSPYPDLLDRKELSAAISFPILCESRVIGVLNISETREGVKFSEVEIEMLSIIVDQAMMALENIRINREKEENKKIRTMLEQYVSAEVSGLLLENKQDLLDVGVVQDLTVLFADIRNFTLLVQHLEPDMLRVFLNSFFDNFGKVVFSYQGMLDKFMGDAALVVFGAPLQIDNPSRVAVSAARDVVLEFEKLRAVWQKKDPVFANIGLGIGISRGPMFLGNVGSSQRLDYTVIGTDVNIAQRLASVTISGQILISDRVYRNLDDDFEVSRKKQMLLKGMEAEITVYSIPAADRKNG